MAARVWLTIPTFNEAENVEAIARAALAQLEVHARGEHRLLIVDDASGDGTAQIADRLAAELPAVEVLHRPTKNGLGQAYVAGFQRALAGGAELVLVMDADFSHDPQYIPALLAAADAGADLVLGSRYVRGGAIIDWPPLRRVLSRAGSVYARTILGLDLRDLTGGYRCIRRGLLEQIDLAGLRGQGYVFNIELAYRASREGFRITEVPITFRDRVRGESKISLAIAVEALWLVPTLRWVRSSVRPGIAAVPEEAGERAGPGDQQDLDRQVASKVR